MKAKFKIAMVTGLLIICSALALAFQIHLVNLHTDKKPVAAKDTIRPQITYDTVALSRFRLLCEKYDQITNGNYTLSGNVYATCKADTLQNLKQVAFLYCKSDSDFYYRIGASETLNAAGLYLFVDHFAKKIFLTRHKEEQAEHTSPISLGQMQELLRSEFYKMAVSHQGEDLVISFTNPSHITCKEYRIVFDPEKLQVKEMMTRVRDLNHPLETEHDRVMTVSVSEFDNRGKPEKFLTTEAVVKMENGKWAPVAKLNDYQLLNDKSL